MSSIRTRHHFEDRLAEAWPPASWGGYCVLLAVSGGPDSMALLRAMHALASPGPSRLAVAHFNHRLRGRESDADEAFVAESAKRLHLPCETGHPPRETITPSGGEGLEAAARRARYRFLTHAAARLGARFVAVAHTADDQAETILHRIVRGTGIDGLSGMCRARPLSEATTLIRPLLGFRRAEVRSYLDDIGQPYRLDATNLDLRRTRSRIRHSLLPELAANFNPDVIGAVLRLGSLAGDLQSVVRGIVDQRLEHGLVSCDADEACLDTNRLKETPRYLLRELFIELWRRQGWPRRHMGFSEWEFLAATCTHGTRGPRGVKMRHTLPGRILLEADASIVRLRRMSERQKGGGDDSRSGGAEEWTA